MHERNKIENSKRTNEKPTKDFVIDNTVGHKIDTSRRNRYGKELEPFYRVISFGYET